MSPVVKYFEKCEAARISLEQAKAQLAQATAEEHIRLEQWFANAHTVLDADLADAKADLDAKTVLNNTLLQQQTELVSAALLQARELERRCLSLPVSSTADLQLRSQQIVKMIGQIQQTPVPAVLKPALLRLNFAPQADQFFPANSAGARRVNLVKIDLPEQTFADLMEVENEEERKRERDVFQDVSLEEREFARAHYYISRFYSDSFKDDKEWDSVFESVRATLESM